MIMDKAAADVGQLFAFAAAVLALGAVYWLVRDQDRRDDDI
ncbi:MAG: phosphate-starvation-inducible PsiE family protein [Bradyrhizobium sp.]